MAWFGRAAERFAAHAAPRVAEDVLRAGRIGESSGARAAEHYFRPQLALPAAGGTGLASPRFRAAEQRLRNPVHIRSTMSRAGGAERRALMPGARPAARNVFQRHPYRTAAGGAVALGMMRGRQGRGATGNGYLPPGSSSGGRGF